MREWHLLQLPSSRGPASFLTRYGAIKTRQYRLCGRCSIAYAALSNRRPSAEPCRLCILVLWQLVLQHQPSLYPGASFGLCRVYVFVVFVIVRGLLSARIGNCRAQEPLCCLMSSLITQDSPIPRNPADDYSVTILAKHPQDSWPCALVCACVIQRPIFAASAVTEWKQVEIILYLVGKHLYEKFLPDLVLDNDIMQQSKFQASGNIMMDSQVK